MLHFKFCLALIIFFSHSAISATSLYINANTKQALYIEQLLLQANVAQIKKPFPVNTVQHAYNKVCINNVSNYCQETKQILDEYTTQTQIKLKSVTVSHTDRSNGTVANQFGLPYDNQVQLKMHGHYAHSNWFKASVDLEARDNDLSWQHAYVSVGWDVAQLDIGYRSHWLSPFQNSSMLVSTHAETMPTITLSNSRSLTPFNIQYELFVAQMSESNYIYYNGELTTGTPILTGIHISISPFEGFRLSANRLMQSGGRDKSISISDLLKAFIDPSGEDNTSDELSVDEQFGNQAATLNAKYTFSGANPVAIYLEYGGEDTSRGYNWRLGNSAMSAGIFMPQITDNLGLTLEWSDWQNGWYSHHVYRAGLTNEQNIIGHWAAEYRHFDGEVFNDSVGASNIMLQGQYQYDDDNLIIIQFDQINNADYSRYDYSNAHKLQLQWFNKRSWADLNLNVEFGKTAMAEQYYRLAVGVNW